MHPSLEEAARLLNSELRAELREMNAVDAAHLSFFHAVVVSANAVSITPYDGKWMTDGEHEVEASSRSDGSPHGCPGCIRVLLSPAACDVRAWQSAHDH